jgi:hypothetical protein
MKIMLIGFAVFVALFSAALARADGCYICRNDGNAYVKFVGEDTQDKRKKAEACGCNVGGYTGSCYAANLKVLCTVSQARPAREVPVMSLADKLESSY